MVQPAVQMAQQYSDSQEQQDICPYPLQENTLRHKHHHPGQVYFTPVMSSGLEIPERSLC